MARQRVERHRERVDKYQDELDELIINLDKLNEDVEFAQRMLERAKNMTFSGGNRNERRRFDADKAQRIAMAQQSLDEAELRHLSAQEKINQRRERILSKANAHGVNRSELKSDDSRTIEVIVKEKIERDATKEKENERKEAVANLGNNIANILSGIATAAVDIYNAYQEKELNTWLAEQDKYLATIEAGGKMFQRSIKTFQKGMEGALSSSFASITQGVQEGAYAAANTSVDVSTEFLRNTIEDQMDRLSADIKMQNITLETNLKNLQLDAKMANSAANALGGVLGAFGGVGAAVGGALTSVTGMMTGIMTAETDRQVRALERLNEVREKEMQQVADAASQALDAAASAVHSVIEFTQSIENAVLEMDKAARENAKVLGMSSDNIAAYEKFMFQAAKSLSFVDSSGKKVYLNKGGEDMAAAQGAYIEATGRNITMTREDFINDFLLGELLGDQNLATALLGDMDAFNHTISDSTDMIYEMFQAANKAGISNRKFARDLQENMKMAQKYTFKGGVKGMMNMALWAQKTKFNLRDLESSIDSILDGGVEDIITKSAHLQVLGGNFAMYSDPLGMLYDAMNDPAALGRRFNEMTKNLGHFNKNTGEAEVVGPDVLFLKAYSKATGISYENAREQVQRRVKTGEIDSALGGATTYTDQQRELLYQKAQYDTKTGKWTVALDHGKRVEDIGNLSEQDFEQLMPVEEAIYDKVSGIYNLLEQMGGVQKYSLATMADGTRESTINEVTKRMNEDLNFITTNMDTLTGMVRETSQFVTEQNSAQHDIMLATNGILTQYFDIIKGTTSDLKSKMEDSSKDMHAALDVLSAQLTGDAEAIKKASEKLLETLNVHFKEAAKGLSENWNAEQFKNVWKNYEGSRSHTKEDTGQAMWTLKQIRDNKNLSDELKLKLAKQALLQSDNLLGYNLFHELKGLNLANTLDDVTLDMIDQLIQNAPSSIPIVPEKNKRKVVYSGDNGKIYFNDLSKRQRYHSTSPIYNYGEGESEQFTKDAVIQPNGNPSLIPGKKITPIRDGVARTARNDKILAFQPGGPIDTALNGVVSAMHTFSDVIQPAMRSYYNDGYRSLSGGGQTNIRLTIDGTLNIKDGQTTIDILRRIADDPNFNRMITQTVSQGLVEGLNGRTINPYDKRYATSYG